MVGWLWYLGTLVPVIGIVQWALRRWPTAHLSATHRAFHHGGMGCFGSDGFVEIQKGKPHPAG